MKKNEKQVWLHKKYRELTTQANKLIESIKEEKFFISKCIKLSGEFCLRSLEHFNKLNRLRRKLKKVEKEILIVKQLIKETK